MHISFEIISSGNAIQICCDEEGIAALIKQFQLAQESGHLHIRDTSAKYGILSTKTPWDKPAVSEVIITTGGD